jgi:hypothetical protein
MQKSLNNYIALNEWKYNEVVVWQCYRKVIVK